MRVLERLGAESRPVRVPRELQGLDGLIIPGGELTTMTLGIEREGLAAPLRDLVRAGTPVLGTCAGLIMLDRSHLGLLDIEAERNAFGRQVKSFEVDLDVPALGGTLHGVFIRAPWVAAYGDGVEVLAEVDGHPVAVREGEILAVGFSSRDRWRHAPARVAARAVPANFKQRRADTVRDQRAEALAQILVRYSTKVKQGDVCVVQGTTAAEPLVLAVYEEVLRAGGLPILQMSPEDAMASFFALASDAQLDWIPPTTEWTTENADVRIVAMADENVRALSRVDPKKQARNQKARRHLMETSMRRSSTGGR